METEAQTKHRADLAKRIKPDVEELLRVEIQIKKLKGSIQADLKKLNARKKELTKRVEECMTEHKLENIRGGAGTITLVSKEAPVPLNSETLVDSLTEVLDDRDKAIQLAASVLEHLPTAEKKQVKVKPEKSATSSNSASINIHAEPSKNDDEHEPETAADNEDA